MEVIGLFVLILWLFVIPGCIGAGAAAFVDKQRKSPAFMWITGMILMWAAFQLICVPFVLLEAYADGMFPWVVRSFLVVSLAAAAVSILMARRKTAGLKALGVVPLDKRRIPLKEKLLWVVFFALVMLQLAASVFLTYGDGDDAFYVTVSTLTEASNTLYKMAPYNVGTTGLDIRHGLAPFPIWIAFLSRISGLKTAFVAHTAVGTALIGLTYTVYYKISQILWPDQKECQPIFLIFTALLVLFGDYSYKSPENFMIARSRQGKAALGNIIIPVVFLLLLMILKQIQEGEKAEWMLWILLCAAVTAACLCSTLGTFLMCLLLGITGVCAGVLFKSLRIVIYMVICCIPAIVFAVMYFWLG